MTVFIEIVELSEHEGVTWLVSGKPLILILLASILALPACSNNDNPINTPSVDNTNPSNNQGVALLIEPGNVDLQVGASMQVTALLNQDGDIKRDLPTTWVSLNPEIVSIDANGKITALKPGNTRVKAQSLGNEALILVSVTPASASNGASPAPTTGGATPATPDASVQGDDSETSPELAKLRTIVIKPENEAVQPTLFKFSRLGEQRQFVAIGKDSEAQDISSLTFSWSSSDENVATVNSTGVVTAVATGTTNLIASAGNVTSNIVQVVVQEGTIRANIRFTE